ncbi:MAG: deoxynucleoside kinase [bacterium]|nr:deoxynucleoside kinase [bacterium]MDA1024456.1 deoxynucleoside kinase [bacterium]
MRKGTFIVIDGTDGSGKATQTNLLVTRLKTEGYTTEIISFPQYKAKSAGMVENYLEGKYGHANDVSAKQASVLYAIDRFDASMQIRAWLAAGKCVVADRYVGSNLAHQGSKMTPEERDAFYVWNDHFEHEIMGIPRPDVNFVLHVPFAFSWKMKQEAGKKGDLKDDIHESDKDHLKAAFETYGELTARFETFQRIECVEDNQLLSRNQIHARIWNATLSFLT